MPRDPQAAAYLFDATDPHEAFLAGSIAPFFSKVREALDDALDGGLAPPVVFVEVGPGCAPPQIVAGELELIERETGYSLDPPPRPRGNLYVVGPSGNEVGFIAGYVSWAHAMRASSAALGAAAAQFRKELDHESSGGVG